MPTDLQTALAGAKQAYRITKAASKGEWLPSLEHPKVKPIPFPYKTKGGYEVLPAVKTLTKEKPGKTDFKLKFAPSKPPALPKEIVKPLKEINKTIPKKGLPPQLLIGVQIASEVFGTGTKAINAIKNPSNENLLDLASDLGRAGQPVKGVVRGKEWLESLSPSERTELLIRAAGVRTKTDEDLAKRRKKSRPCPYDIGTASDGSSCGGRSAQSRGKTAGYDTPEGFFERFN